MWSAKKTLLDLINPSAARISVGKVAVKVGQEGSKVMPVAATKEGSRKRVAATKADLIREGLIAEKKASQKAVIHDSKFNCSPAVVVVPKRL